MKIVNLTQHLATEQQKAQGVFEPTQKEEVRKLLTFEGLPTGEEVIKRAVKLARIAAEEEADAAMIGGAPFLMRFLEDALVFHGIEPVYAFSKRVTEEYVNDDGTVVKKQIFKHEGFVRLYSRNT